MASMSADIGARADSTWRVHGSIRVPSLRRRVGSHPAFILARVLPELPRDLDRVDASGFPPGPFVTGAVGGPVVDAAERDREFVARFVAKRARLQVAQVMGVGRLAPADQAGLLHHI